MAPELSPFSFGEEPANAGNMASVQCAVITGDLPLEITWMFEGRPIESARSDIIISGSGKRLKHLTIESVAARHAGEYTCVASNVAGSVARSSTLKVNGTQTSHVLRILVKNLNFPQPTFLAFSDQCIIQVQKEILLELFSI